MYIVSKINYQRFRWMAPLLLAVSIILLALCYTPLGVEINGVNRWLNVFLVAGPTFQPSEIAKVAVVLFFAARLCKRDTEKQRRFTKRTTTGRVLNRSGSWSWCPMGRSCCWCWCWWSSSPICRARS